MPRGIHSLQASIFRCNNRFGSGKVPGRDYFSITYLHQRLIYWKELSVKISISAKDFKTFIKFYAKNIFIPIIQHTYNEIKQSGSFRYNSLFSFISIVTLIKHDISVIWFLYHHQLMSRLSVAIKLWQMK